MTGGGLTIARFLQAGDTALTVELGATAEIGLSLRVLELYRRIGSAALPGVVEMVPTLRSLTVHYDPCVTSSRALRGALAPIVEVALAENRRDVSADGNAGPAPARRWLIPACYAPELGPDIASVAAACGLGAGEVPALHASVPYSFRPFATSPIFISATQSRLRNSGATMSPVFDWLASRSR